ncbi:hypothetical protein BJX62DRAFT_245412 [Aspergillus germanicus]
MADPVWIAASAAGLIALSLKSCRLSVNFCDNWRGFGDDVDNVRLKAPGLLSTLTLIQSLLINNTTVHRAITADIMAKVGDNEKLIEKAARNWVKGSISFQYLWVGQMVSSAPYWKSTDILRGQIGPPSFRARPTTTYPPAAEALLDLGAPVSLQDLKEWKSQPMKHLIIGKFVSRQRRLLELAKSTLSGRVQDGLGLLHPGASENLPDSDAQAVFDELKVVSPCIDLALKPRDFCPGFHNTFLSVDQMEYLYQVGFRDINALDEDGYPAVLAMMCSDRLLTTMIVEHTISRLLWLISKGLALFNGDAHDENENGGIITITIFGFQPSLLHIAALTIMVTLAQYDVPHPLRQADLDIIPAILASLPDDHRDFLKDLFSYSCWDMSVTVRALLLGPWGMHVVAPVLKSFVTETQSRIEYGNKLIRLLTFHDLSMTHTCCRARYGRWAEKVQIESFHGEDDATADTHDNERFLLEEFETLVEELQEQYEAVGGLVWNFIQTRWAKLVWGYLAEHERTVTWQALRAAVSRNVAEYADDDDGDDNAHE